MNIIDAYNYFIIKFIQDFQHLNNLLTSRNFNKIIELDLNAIYNW